MHSVLAGMLTTPSAGQIVKSSGDRCECHACGCQTILVHNALNSELCEHCNARVCYYCLVEHHSKNCVEAEEDEAHEIEEDEEELNY